MQIKCDRCQGKGTVGFTTYQAGICFKCGGVGKIEITAAAFKARERRKVKAAETKAARDVTAATRAAANELVVQQYIDNPANVPAGMIDSYQRGQWQPLYYWLADNAPEWQHP
jgi:predicted NBD/HSP70 family sugar kinase|tara:strand:+ start:4589 stop:4927 length:339 start_codon:yes stop_codon:yes gene_type:complete